MRWQAVLRSSPTVRDPATPSTPTIILIEDEAHIRRFLHVALESSGYCCIEAATGQAGLIEAAVRRPDLVILDLGLPDLNGIEVIRQLRTWSSVPVIIVSAREQEGDKVRALDAGADDYVSKPFGIDELRARVRAALRHATNAQGSEPRAFTVGDLAVDLARRRVSVRGRDVHLSPTEYKILMTLVRGAGMIITQAKLSKEVWDSSPARDAHHLRVQVGRLRHKLEIDPAQPRYVLTEPGIGYRMGME